MSLSANGERMKELIQAILFNEVCNQCWTFHAFYRRKNCILTSRFHNRGRVWRATERFIDGFLLLPLFIRSALRNFCTWILCTTRRRAELFSGLKSWKFLFVWRSLSSPRRLFEKQEIKQKGKKMRERRISKRSFTVIPFAKARQEPFVLFLPTWHSKKISQKLQLAEYVSVFTFPWITTKKSYLFNSNHESRRSPVAAANR